MVFHRKQTRQILYAIFFAVSAQEYSVLLMLEGKPTYKCVSCVKALRSSRDDKTPVRSFWSASISELSKKIGSMERKIILAHVTLYAA